MGKLLRSTSTDLVGNHQPKTTIEPNPSEDWVISIREIEYPGAHTLTLTFEDGSVQTIDFEPFLSRSNHPEIRLYLDVERFKDYTLKAGELHWHDYRLCFPIADLYEGKV